MKLVKYLITCGTLLLVGVCSAAVATKNLRCEYLSDPLGIGTVEPRLSWILVSQQRGEKQTGYQILVASSEKLLNDDVGDLWDSGKVMSDESSQVAYQGKSLVSRQQCYWKVRAWDQAGKAGAWSSIEQWQMGLLTPADWQAQWISAVPPAGNTNDTLIIRRATYEAVEGNRVADVTTMLASRVKQNHLKLEVNNKTLGVDPAFNVVKRLRVQYEYAGKTFEKEIDENQTLALPESD